MPRTSIPSPTRQLVLIEAGYKCANPVCRSILTLELHHIEWVKDGGGNEPSNLLALCPNCHALHTHGHIPEQAIRTWKAMLAALNSTNHAAADLLLMIAQDEERLAAAAGDIDPNSMQSPFPFHFTGDGLPALSGLIASGLLEIAYRYRNATGVGRFDAVVHREAHR